MIVSGLTLAILTGTAFYFIFRKLPRSIRRFLQKHILFTDAVACLLTYMLLGGTLVALFASAWLCVITTVLLHLSNNPATAVLMERFAYKVGQMKDSFINWAAKFPPPVEEQPKLEVVK
jgi:Ca2+/Na+ antiporter